MRLRLFILSCLVCCCSPGQSQNGTIEPSCPSVFVLHKKGGNQAIRYASNHPLTELDTSVTTVLVYIHGIYRNALLCFGYTEEMVKSARQKKETLIITPQYANADELDYHRLNNDFLYWKKAEWKDGHTSISTDERPQSVKPSSYEVLDSLLTFVFTGNKFPNIKKVVIVGHSAGGQFVQRYSAITPLPDLFPDFPFRFIVMNPSSYMYPDAKRPVGDRAYAVPDAPGCPEYNHYPKGLENLNTYAKAVGAERILNNMLHRDIIILLGEKDTSPDALNLDTTCAANLEGLSRFERGLHYVAYMLTFPGYGNKKSYDIVSYSGHSGEKMINSAEAKKWVYGNTGR